MDIYFVRHGQTAGNVARRHQHADTPLNDLGQIQAQTIAATIAELKPSHLITSTHMRALETARVIGRICDLVPETSVHFSELYRPKALVGERLLGRSTSWYTVKWFFGIANASMHDGEGYDKFRDRLAVARRHLESFPPDARVIVVSHSVFINFFIAHMCRPHRIGLLRAGSIFFQILLHKNTGIAHLRYDPEAVTSRCGWKLISR